MIVIGSNDVPKYSAIKVNGQRLYDYARQFKDVSLPKRLVKINSIQLLELNTDKLKKDAHSKEIQEKLKEEIQTTLDMKINATPTYIINGKRYEGIFKYPDLEKIVIELGAVKKQK